MPATLLAKNNQQEDSQSKLDVYLLYNNENRLSDHIAGYLMEEKK
ncbi:hypothetical protein Sps_00686 [Shewanella psychrophila]|uniref:Uncharacterized protein n=1 Tax=Shewanella psychrophila TaxID=225848 RepID=A0A1S6HK38_9GAMM|nr:hypothetical protein Sps_00686 [Shewanella psychrophila]